MEQEHSVSSGLQNVLKFALKYILYIQWLSDAVCGPSTSHVVTLAKFWVQ